MPLLKRVKRITTKFLSRFIWSSSLLLCSQYDANVAFLFVMFSCGKRSLGFGTVDRCARVPRARNKLLINQNKLKTDVKVRSVIYLVDF